MDSQDLGISVLTVVGSAGGPDGPHNSTCLSECSRRTSGSVVSSSLGQSGHSDAGPNSSCRLYWVNLKHVTTARGCGGGGFFDGGEDLTVEPPLVDDGVVVDGASGDLGGDDIPGHSSVPSEELGCLLRSGGSPASPQSPQSPQSVASQSLGDAASSPD